MQEMQHYYLAAGEITYMVQDDKGHDAINRVRLNTLVTLQDKNITLKHIGAIQQGLQKQLFARTGEPEKVVDVVILSMNYLGEMSAETFRGNETAQ